MNGINEFMDEGELFGSDTPSKEEYVKAFESASASVPESQAKKKFKESFKAGLAESNPTVTLDLATVPGLPQPKNFGVDEVRAETVLAEFRPHLEKYVAVETKAKEFLEGLQKVNKLTKKEFDKARELRLELVSLRGKNGVLGPHTELKAFYLNGGRFVDGLKKFVVDGAAPLENKLDEVENFEQYEREKREASLQIERANQLIGFLQFAPGSGLIPTILGPLTETEWNTFYLGARERDKQLRQEKLDEEKKARANHLYARYLPMAPFDDLGEKKLEYFEELTDAEFQKLYTYLLDARKKSLEEAAAASQRIKDAEAAEALAKLAQTAAEEKIEELKEVSAVTYVTTAGTEPEAVVAEWRGAPEYNNWVSDFKAPLWDFDDVRCKEVLNRFEGFKRWALSLK